MEIRKLTSADAKQFKNLRLEALQTHPEAFSSSFEEEEKYSLETYENRLQSDESFTFGAFENEELVGVVSLVKEKKRKLCHKANIFAMYVSPEKRGKGFAKSLLAEAIQMAKNLNGIEQVNLSVVSTNTAAKKLYSSLGFEVFGKEVKAVKIEDKYFDEDYMVLFL